MSKPNKVNKSNYVQQGRLTPDEMARARVHQAEISGRAKSKENVTATARSDRVGRVPTRRRTAREE